MKRVAAVLWKPLTSLMLGVFLAGNTLGHAQTIEDQDLWRLQLKKPAGRWFATDYDDSDWKEANGGFGTRGTPAARVSTEWTTEDIWLRKNFELENVPETPGLLIHHDEDATVYLNGIQIVKLDGYTTEYQVIALEAPARAALKKGRNLLAVHCHQTGGGQFIDAHIVDANNVPELPAPEFPAEPFKTPLITPWGENLSAENVWQEYPRPQLERSNWINLNGRWDYAVTSDQQQTIPENWDGKILVPFSLESSLSGVQKRLDPDEALWYSRVVELGAMKSGRWLLNFEAVDYECQVFVNGQLVGSHKGGNVPISVDISGAAKAGNNVIQVRVEDDTEAYQLRGKQVLWPGGIWYTQVSGIWQTVWLEHVPETYLVDLKMTSDYETGQVRLIPELNGNKDSRIQIQLMDGNRTVASGETRHGEPLTLSVQDAKLWSPDSPFLYGVKLQVESGDQTDEVRSYTGIRGVGKVLDESGHWRFTLNGKPVFHWGPLDQGWWPDGLLTPPSDEAMRFDVDYLKQAGFNMIRKHIKVEPRRYYAYCDRIGMLVWQDQVSAGHSPAWTRLQPNPADSEWPDEQHEQFMVELEEMIDNLENHPSIVVWVPFNEAWGQHRTVSVGEWTMKRDPSRLTNIASGGNFWPVGDIVDQHAYPHPAFPFNRERYQNFVKVVGEFGGHGYPVKGHLWDVSRGNWGYGGLPKDEQEYLERYVESIRRLAELKAQGISAGVYTQTTDVEVEINGLMTYDRKVIKIPADKLRKIHEEAGLLK